MLEATDGGTQVTYNHSAMGRISEAQMENYDKGWQDLIGARLKAFVERSERMGLGHEPNWATSYAAPAPAGLRRGPDRLGAALSCIALG